MKAKVILVIIILSASLGCKGGSVVEVRGVVRVIGNTPSFIGQLPNNSGPRTEIVITTDSGIDYRVSEQSTEMLINLPSGVYSFSGIYNENGLFNVKNYKLLN